MLQTIKTRALWKYRDIKMRGEKSLWLYMVEKFGVVNGKRKKLRNIYQNIQGFNQPAVLKLTIDIRRKLRTFETYGPLAATW